MTTSNKPWLNTYPQDVPEFINIDQYANINEMFKKPFEQFADNTAFVNMGHSLNYQQLNDKSDAFAAYLQSELKAKKGDRIALMMPNLLQYPICILGALKAGLVVVNVNPLYTPRELEHQLRDSGATIIVAVTNFGDSLQQVISRTSLKHVILTSIGDELAPHKRTLVNFVVKYVKKMVPKYHLPSAISLRRALTHGKRLDFNPPKIEQSDLAYLQYTGGTTGLAKGAMLTHKNVMANVLQVFGHFGPRTAKDKEHAVTPLPLYHIFANSVSMMLMMYMGGSNLLITNPRDLNTFVNDLSKYPFTMIFGLNTLFAALINHAKFKELDFSNAEFTIAGGMATQKHVADEWQAITGMPIIEGYGLTECSPVVAGGVHTQQQFVPAIGVPLPSTEMRIVDDTGMPLGANQVGEIQIRGDQVMAGYWKQDAETKAVLTEDGWLNSGDIGRMDDDGVFYIEDRKKDMILVSGFNVFPTEVEEVATLHPKIIEAAAVGVPDDVAGERVKLIVVTNGSVSVDDIKKHCRQHLTGYKIPKVIEFREELPKTNVGKILRRELRD
ncbi:long-chain-fatty-acid--CoA ligase [Vibrio breoganii]|uniref:AMP-binding protein n=1 Tax=Vibrio breoganii TaxID=553239 RepID=UPI0002E4E2E0|nr:AMP-binding protein [Vibrio breoganii]OEF83258.1 long-chain-fatty-acid--CoA ligase [Vibrio breoganii 1C10]PMK74957.1 long-chain-fatty-acid--CoA ligase [Vibrio breoganii]PML41304.1 long-chain-fatty-acid--CoA ligase [Vibrio breoganii]PML61660.1 long-chain-fatty-acid--CoA ligase [Vibrio breoganii]PMO77129.1 long-chain-fatty-acid--CoA ligase [Vibrio breoganii]